MGEASFELTGGPSGVGVIDAKAWVPGMGQWQEAAGQEPAWQRERRGFAAAAGSRGSAKRAGLTSGNPCLPAHPTPPQSAPASPPTSWVPTSAHSFLSSPQPLPRTVMGSWPDSVKD